MYPQLRNKRNEILNPFLTISKQYVKQYVNKNSKQYVNKN